jgi:hypothetical protein
MRFFQKLSTGLLLIFSLSHSANSFAQTKDEKKIIAVIRQEEETWSRGDIEGYVSLYAPHDSTRMILSKGAAYGKEKMLAFY